MVALTKIISQGDSCNVLNLDSGAEHPNKLFWHVLTPILERVAVS